MFRVLAITLLLCLSSTIYGDESIVFREFMEFTVKYNKAYTNLTEFTKRYEIFKRNFINILSVDESIGGYKVGITKFSDLSTDEFRTKFLTLKMKQGMCHQSKLHFLSELEYFEIDETLDWREKGGVSPVKDQGQCGSCWAFSAVAFLESQALVKNKQALLFSEQQLVDCDRETGDAGCGGGLMQSAFDYIEQKGIEADSNYPYKGKEGTCTYNKSIATTEVTNVKCYEGLSVDEIKKYLNTVGPLAIAVSAHEFQMYDSGVLSCTSNHLDHGVLLVGYGKEADQEYWVVKNSWGKNWGESGFIRISTKDGESCGIGEYVSMAEIRKC